MSRSTQTWKRIWPTLMSAAAQSACRASHKSAKRSADIHAAIILARSAFDAYLHEFVVLRRLPTFIRFRSGLGARRRLSQRQWRLIADKRTSLSNLSRGQRREFISIQEAPFLEKLQTTILLSTKSFSAPEIEKFEDKFGHLMRLNHLRNSIVHHDFKAPSNALLVTCDNICAAVGAAPLDRSRPWENLLQNPAVGVWACKTASKSLLALEAIDFNRTIHMSATQDSVASAIAPLKL